MAQNRTFPADKERGGLTRERERTAVEDGVDTGMRAAEQAAFEHAVDRGGADPGREQLRTGHVAALKTRNRREPLLPGPGHDEKAPKPEDLNLPWGFFPLWEGKSPTAPRRVVALGLFPRFASRHMTTVTQPEGRRTRK